MTYTEISKEEEGHSFARVLEWMLSLQPKPVCDCGPAFPDLNEHAKTCPCYGPTDEV